MSASILDVGPTRETAAWATPSSATRAAWRCSRRAPPPSSRRSHHRESRCSFRSCPQGRGGPAKRDSQRPRSAVSMVCSTALSSPVSMSVSSSAWRADQSRGARERTAGPLLAAGPIHRAGDRGRDRAQHRRDDRPAYQARSRQAAAVDLPLNVDAERCFADDTFAWELKPDGAWERRTGGERSVHHELMERARERSTADEA